MPRRKKLPPNLYWRKNTPNIYFYFEVDGRVFQGSTHTADIAKAMDMLEVEQGKAWNEIRFGRTEKQEILFSDAYKIVLKKRLWGEGSKKHQETIANKKNQILNAIGDFNLSEIDATFTGAYIPARQKVAERRGRQPYTKTQINQELAFVKTILISMDNKVDRDKYILPEKISLNGKPEDWPIQLIKTTKAERERHTILESRDEAMQLMDAIVPHARPIILTAILTGLRQANVLGLNISDINLQAGTISVVQKGGKHHIVPIHEELYPLFVKLIGDRKRGPLFIFGQNNCHCTACAQYRKPATSGKANYVSGQLNRLGTKKRVKNIELGKIFESASEARRQMVKLGYYGCNASKIGDVCKGKQETAGGFHWEYVAPPNDNNKPVINLRQQSGRIGSINKSFTTARKKIERPDLRFHDLRHTIATWMIESGTPLSLVQELLGHSDIRTTMRYIKNSPKTVRHFLDNSVSFKEQNSNETLTISLHSDALTAEVVPLKSKKRR